MKHFVVGILFVFLLYACMMQRLAIIEMDEKIHMQEETVEEFQNTVNELKMDIQEISKTRREVEMINKVLERELDDNKEQLDECISNLGYFKDYSQDLIAERHVMEEYLILAENRCYSYAVNLQNKVCENNSLSINGVALDLSLSDFTQELENINSSLVETVLDESNNILQVSLTKDTLISIGGVNVSLIGPIEDVKNNLNKILTPYIDKNGSLTEEYIEKDKIIGLFFDDENHNRVDGIYIKNLE